MTEPMPMPPPRNFGETAEKHSKSKGERYFDRAVYGGIAGVGTFVATIFLADELKDGRWKWFQEKLTNVIERLATKVAPNRSNRKLAEDAAMTTSLMMGGNVMLLPVGVAEHYKVPLVSGLNTAADDPTPKEAIKQAPKQTWQSLAKSRGLAWLAVFAGFKGLGMVFADTMKTFEIDTGKLLCKITGRPTHDPSRLVRVIEQGEALLKPAETRTFRYGKLAALDVFATIGSATLLYIGGHFFARRQEERHERKLAARHNAAGAGGHASDEVETLNLPASPDVATAPNVTVQGEKLHVGMAQEQALTPQLT